MKITPDSDSGKHLLGHPHGAHGAHSFGAEPADLEKATFLVFNFQVGAAITLPVPFLGGLILHKSKFLDDDRKEFRDTSDLWLVRHELCHVAQIRRWGVAKYLAKHVWARVRHLSLLAESSRVEACCYQVHRSFRDETF